MTRHSVLVNGLSIGGGGGYTVGRELTRAIALARPDWSLVLLLGSGHPLHEAMRREGLPDNVALEYAPGASLRFASRARYARRDLPALVSRRKVEAVVQLNGMLPGPVGVPCLVHFQDPWPYRPQAWVRLRDRPIAAMKRLANRRALHGAEFVTWTSGYLRDVVCGHHRLIPRHQAVLYNGVPASWIERAQRLATESPRQRPPTLVSVSNISPYKRQDLVVRAVAELQRHPALEGLKYRIIGHCEPAYRRHLERLASRLGVADRVTVEGRVADAAVASAYESARCFVLMSVCESFGIPAVEAMSFATPVVTSACCAMPEVCGDAAALCPVDDVRALAAELARVMTDPEHAGRLRDRGLRRVKNFNWLETGRAAATAIETITTDTQRP